MQSEANNFRLMHYELTEMDNVKVIWLISGLKTHKIIFGHNNFLLMKIGNFLTSSKLIK